MLLLLQYLLNFLCIYQPFCLLNLVFLSMVDILTTNRAIQTLQAFEVFELVDLTRHFDVHRNKQFAHDLCNAMVSHLINCKPFLCLSRAYCLTVKHFILCSPHQNQIQCIVFVFKICVIKCWKLNFADNMHTLAYPRQSSL